MLRAAGYGFFAFQIGLLAVNFPFSNALQSYEKV